MAKQKIEFGWFTVPEWEKEEKWLKEHHQRGWKLVNATVPGFYRFEQCEPEDVVYQLDYNQEGMNNIREYIQLFRDCGWEYVTDMVGYAYFRKPASEMVEDEGIFCDDESKMDMIKRVFKGRISILIVLFLCCILPQILQIGRWAEEGASGAVVCALIGFVFGMYVVLFIQFAIKYRQTKKRLEK